MKPRFWSSVIVCTAISITAPAATQAHYVQVVNKAPTITTVQASTLSAFAGTPIVLAVRITTPNSTVAPDGTVILTDGASALVSASLVNGTASITKNLPSLGNHQMKVCYLGGDNFAASCSMPLTLSSLPPYTLKQATQSAEVAPFTPFTDQLTVIPATGYVGTVQLGCHAKSEYYQCAVSPSTVELAGKGEPQAISTTFIPYVPWPAGSFLSVPMLGILWLKRGRREVLSKIFSALTATTLLAGLSGCGSGTNSPYMPTRPGTYDMVVSATAANYSQSVTYQMTVR
jgi:hypothetical protein